MIRVRPGAAGRAAALWGCLKGLGGGKRDQKAQTVPGVGLLHEFGVMKWHT